MRRYHPGRVFYVTVILLAAACGDDASTSGGDGGAGQGGSSDIGDDEPWQLAAAETCKLSVPSLGLALEGKGRALRNGSGNVIVECFGFEGSAATLEIGIGNGDYDGPGDYPMINDWTRGDLTLHLDDETAFSNATDDVASGCELTVTTAQPGNYPDVGTRFAGKFSCTKLENLDQDAGSEAVDLDEGAFDLTVI